MRMDTLNKDTFPLVASHFDALSLIRMSLTSKKFRELCRDERLWKIQVDRYCSKTDGEKPGLEFIIRMVTIKVRCVHMMYLMLIDPVNHPGAFIRSIFPAKCMSRMFSIELKHALERDGKSNALELARKWCPYDTSYFGKDADSWNKFRTWNRFMCKIVLSLGIRDLPAFDRIESDVKDKSARILRTVQTVDAIRIVYRHLRDELGMRVPCHYHWEERGIYDEPMTADELQRKRAADREIEKEKKKKRTNREEEKEGPSQRLEPIVKSMICHAHFGYKIDLPRFIRDTILNATSVPEKLDCTAISFEEKKWSAILFPSGSVVMTGMKNQDEVEQLWNILLDELKRLGY